MDIKVGDLFEHRGSLGRGPWTVLRVLSADQSGERWEIGYNDRRLVAFLPSPSWRRHEPEPVQSPPPSVNMEAVRAGLLGMGKALGLSVEPRNKLMELELMDLLGEIKCAPGCAPAAPCMRAECPAIEEARIDGRIDAWRVKKTFLKHQNALAGLRQARPDGRRSLPAPSFSGLGALVCDMGPAIEMSKVRR